MPSEYLTVGQAATRLNVADNTIRNAIKAGRLVAYKFLGAYRITHEDLTAFVEGSRVGGKGREVKPTPPVAKSTTLKHLDGEKLRAAWTAQGIRAPRTGAGNALSSASRCGPSDEPKS